MKDIEFHDTVNDIKDLLNSLEISEKDLIFLSRKIMKLSYICATTETYLKTFNGLKL